MARHYYLRTFRLLGAPFCVKEIWPEYTDLWRDTDKLRSFLQASPASEAAAMSWRNKVLRQKKIPAGWELVEPTLEEFEATMREAGAPPAARWHSPCPPPAAPR